MSGARQLLAADADQIKRFVVGLFPYADPETFLSLRSFRDDVHAVHKIQAIQVGQDMGPLVEAATVHATACARHERPIVFCPPIATFSSPHHARDLDLANGLALSVECDSHPKVARARLEGILGPATIIVRSGGLWIDPATREVQDKLHLHWRLTEPTRDRIAHQQLLRARRLATLLVGADGSNIPMVHPIRWAGSWHRKAEPRMAEIVAAASSEIELSEALEWLEDAARPMQIDHDPHCQHSNPDVSDEAYATSELIRQTVSGESFHQPLVALAMRYQKGGMPPAQVVLTLRGFMLAVPEAARDWKEGSEQRGRWQARLNDIPRLVSSAAAKLPPQQPVSPGYEEGWLEPVDFLSDPDLTGNPELRPEHLPSAISAWALDSAERMGTDPSAAALAALVALSSVAHDDWTLAPKAYDHSWRESARLWGAIVGNPSILKSPTIKAATRPIEYLDESARRKHTGAMRQHAAGAKARLKADPAAAEEDPPPKLDRYLIESTTIEALTEVLRDDPDAKQRAPLRKVLIRQDEMSEWIGSLDRYSSGRGGADRGAYLRLYNGGLHTVDRVGRGPVVCSNWSGSFLGAIQPDVIQRIARDAADDGLLQRFCYSVPSTQRRGVDRSPDAGALARYNALFPAMSALRPPTLPGGVIPPLTLHIDGQCVRQEVLDLIEAVSAMPSTSLRVQAALGKWPGLFARLTLLFHLVELADAASRGNLPALTSVVCATTAKQAALYMREILLPHLMRADAIMFSSPQTENARKIAGLILSSGRDCIKHRDIARTYKALAIPERRTELLNVMSSLEAMAWVRAEVPANPSRPPCSWLVNPRVFTNFAERARIERETRRQTRSQIAETVTRIRQQRTSSAAEESGE